jgi:hypothetical protein
LHKAHSSSLLHSSATLQLLLLDTPNPGKASADTQMERLQEPYITSCKPTHACKPVVRHTLLCAAVAEVRVMPMLRRTSRSSVHMSTIRHNTLLSHGCLCAAVVPGGKGKHMCRSSLQSRCPLVLCHQALTCIDSSSSRHKAC